MKIQPPFQWEPVAPGNRQSVRGTADGAEFSRALKDAIGSVAPEATAAKTPAAALSRPRAPGPVSLDMRIDRLLDAVERYSEKLGDTRCPVGEIRPLVEALERQRPPLQAELEGLPEQHPLRPIIGELLTTIAAEKARFDQGHYGG